MTGEKKRRRGRPPDAEAVARVGRSKRPDVVHAFETTAIAALADIRRRLRTQEPIAIELLGIVRLCAEWHTDFLSVQMGGGSPEDDAPSSAGTPTKP